MPTAQLLCWNKTKLNLANHCKIVDHIKELEDPYKLEFITGFAKQGKN
jgi:hypothetical protein